MKKIAAVALLLLSVALAIAQTPEITEIAHLPKTIEKAEVVIGENDWASLPIGAISDQSLIAKVGHMLNHAHLSVGYETPRLLDEFAQRDAIVTSRWVNHRSPRLQPESADPATHQWRIFTSGEFEYLDSSGMAIGSDQAQLQLGSLRMHSVATIDLEYWTLTNPQMIGSLEIVVDRTRSATSFAGAIELPGRLRAAAFKTPASDPGTTFGLSNIKLALQKLAEELDNYRPGSGGRH